MRTALLLLMACAPKRPETIAALVAHGDPEEACSVAAEAAGDAETFARLERGLADTLLTPRPVLRARVVPAAELGGASEDYAVGWAVVEARVDGGAAPPAELDLTLDLALPTPEGARAFAVCPPDRCHAGWVAERLGVTKRPPGGLLSALATLGRVVLLPLAVALDAATAPARLMSDDDSPLLTVELLRGMAPPEVPPGPAGFPPVWSADRCAAGAPCLRRWVVVAADPDPAVSSGVRAVLSWTMPRCELRAAWTLPAGSATASEALAALAPTALTDTAPVSVAVALRAATDGGAR